jgi:tetratricopeptide (TPR) repeat protein
MKKGIAILVLCVSLAAFSGLKLHLDRIPRAQVPGASILYLPSGKSLQYMSLGNRPLMADLIYLWAIQYFSNAEVADRYDHLEHVFSIIAELDPRYVDPYSIGAMIAGKDAGDMETAFRILDLGLEKNPDQWIFPLEAGHTALMQLKDFELAREYFKKAMEIPGAPPMTRRLYADASTKLTDYRTAFTHWLEIYETTDDKRVKDIAYNHVYRLKSLLDFEDLAQDIQKYRERFGRYPDDLSQLVTTGLRASIPPDLEGNAYVYDQETGEVTTARLWWKR